MTNTEDQKYITSKDIITKTGISRATLNNYIKMGILPRPVVKKAGEDMQGTKHIGFFPESVLGRIDLVKQLKQEGEPMEKIAKQFGNDSRIVEMFPGPEARDRRGASHETDMISPMEGPDTTGSDTAAEDFREGETAAPARREKRRRTDSNVSIQTKDLKLTVSDLNMPAYLVNHNFEVEWVNKEAEQMIFNSQVSHITEVEERNIFRLFFGYDFQAGMANWKDILGLHAPFLRSGVEKDSLPRLYPGMSDPQITLLKELYDSARPESATAKNVGSIPVKLVRNDGAQQFYQVHSMRFREGIFFIYVPSDGHEHHIMEYLARREIIINDLLKQRMPALVSLCVLVADLQDSVKISAELLPGEYFSLINSLWESLAGCFEQFGGIYGKHAGDGMLYYFIKKPGTNYVMNSINCAIELRKRMKEFSSDWKIKKGWLDDMYLNIGINEGQEFFGTIRSAPTVEFTALGDSINYAGRLSDFARYGEIWTTKSVIGKLEPMHLENLRFGVNREVRGRTIFTPSGFSRMIDIIKKEDNNYNKFIDIATLPITQIMDPAS